MLPEMLVYLGRLVRAGEKEELLFLLQTLAWPIAQCRAMRMLPPQLGLFPWAQLEYLDY